MLLLILDGEDGGGLCDSGPGTTLATGALSGRFRQHIANYKVPSSVEFALDSPCQKVASRVLNRPAMPFNDAWAGGCPLE